MKHRREHNLRNSVCAELYVFQVDRVTPFLRYSVACASNEVTSSPTAPILRAPKELVVPGSGADVPGVGKRKRRPGHSETVNLLPHCRTFRCAERIRQYHTALRKNAGNTTSVLNMLSGTSCGPIGLHNPTCQKCR